MRKSLQKEPRIVIIYDVYCMCLTTDLLSRPLRKRARDSLWLKDFMV